MSNRKHQSGRSLRVLAAGTIAHSFAKLLMVACLALAYVGSYVALSAAGDYRASQTGKLRYNGRLSVTDVYHWQPRFMWWEPFHNVYGRDTSRGNLAGYFYSPLIRMNRAWFHPSQYLSDMSVTTQPTR